jgi:hypothetical protein
MKPATGNQVWRKAARRERRGVATGRKATHPVLTKYGRHQKERDRLAVFAALAAGQEMLHAVPRV